MVDVSKYLDILTLEFLVTSVRLPFCPGYKQMLRLLLVLRILVVSKNSHYFCKRHLWRWWSLLCKYFVRSWIIFHYITSEYNSTVFLVLSNSTTRPLHFWNFGSNSEFLRWQRSMNDAAITSLLFLTFASCNAGIFFRFPIIFPLLSAHLLFSWLQA